MSGAPLIDAAPRRLIVLCPTWVGDTIMATPVFRALREALPECEIIALGRNGVASLLNGLPYVDQVDTIDMKGLLGPMRGSRTLRAHEADAIVLLPNSVRSALVAKFSGIRIRAGYDRDRRGGLLTHPIAVPQSDGPMPTVQYYAHLACALLGRATIDERLTLAVTEDEQREAEAALGPCSSPAVLLNPGGNKAPKRWPAERFAALADALHAQWQCPIIVSGAPTERPLLDDIVSRTQCDVINLSTSGVSLTGLKAVIAGCRLVVTNDTGPRHIAAALGVPLVSLFGPTDHRWTTLEGVKERILLAEPFLPENLIADKHPRACRIDRIPVRDVLAACQAADVR